MNGLFWDNKHLTVHYPTYYTATYTINDCKWNIDSRWNYYVRTKRVRSIVRENGTVNQQLPGTMINYAVNRSLYENIWPQNAAVRIKRDGLMGCKASWTPLLALTFIRYTRKFEEKSKGSVTSCQLWLIYTHRKNLLLSGCLWTWEMSLILVSIEFRMFLLKFFEKWE